MDQKKVINIARDFADEPIGRFPSDSEYNGQRFREEFLVPALQNYEKVVVILDEAEGYGSSFLDEAFGGLVRVNNFSKDDLLRRLEFVSIEDSSLILEIKEYIEQA